MIPERLKIQGLYSYREPQEINFKDFIKSRLFGIFGPVGSGKSSILEAIRLCLYEECDKFSKRTKNKNYNLLNLKSNKLFIEFEFLIDEKKYKVELSLKRKKNYNQTDSLVRNFYKFENNTWIPENPSELDKLLGISFENFNKTIIIPQGKFQEFITLTPAKRREMLMEIFELEKFDLQAKTKELLKDTENEYSKIEGQLKEIGEVSEDKINEIILDIRKLDSLIKEKEIKLNDLREKNKTMEKLAERFYELEKNKSVLNQLNSEKNEIDNKKEIVEKFKYCKTEFKEIINSRKNLQKKIIELEDRINKLEEDEKIKQENYNKEKNRFEVINRKFLNLSKLEKEIESYEKIRDILKLKNILNEILDNIQNLQNTLTHQEEVYEKKIEQLEKLKKERIGLEEKLKDQMKLFEAKEWFEKKKSIETNLKEIEKEFEAEKREIKSIKNKRDKKIKEKKLNVNDDIYKLIEVENESLTNEIERLEKELQEFKVKDKLSEYALNLEEGKPCPLCGSTNHPNKLKPENFEVKIKDLTEEIKYKQKRIKENQQFLNEISKIDIEIKEKNKNIDKLLNKLQRKIDELEKFKKTFKFKEFSINDEEKVNNLIEEFKKLSKEKEKLEEEIATLEKEINVKKSEIDKIKEKFQKLNSKKAGVENEIKLLTSQLIIELNEELTINDCEKRLEELKKEKELIQNNYEELKKKIENLNNELVTIRTQISENKSFLEESKKNLEQIESEICKRVKKSEFSSINEIIKILEKEIDIEKEENLIKEFEEKFRIVKNKVKELEDFLKDKEYNKEDHEKIKKEISDLEKGLKELFHNKGEMEKLLNDTNEKLKKRKELVEKFEMLKKRIDGLDTLKKLFEGKKFVNYVATIYLKDLVNRANRIFYNITKKQLQIELDEENNFIIRDFLNDGKTRDIRTLSGGQLFQASLSLALALSDTIKQSKFFFLDEGFGTLDNESLMTVVDTLRDLQKKGKIIGIISHVDELKNEISDYIKVEILEDRGSIITEIHR